MSPRFSIGDRVRARVVNPAGHTRLPTYVRGRVGAIESVRPAKPLPDHVVHHDGPTTPMPVYGVRFSMTELWGPDAEAGSELVMELWEPYLEPAAGPAAQTDGRDDPDPHGVHDDRNGA